MSEKQKEKRESARGLKKKRGSIKKASFGNGLTLAKLADWSALKIEAPL
jgi:hypothetical protein